MLKILLAFLISTASIAATPGAVPSVTVSASGANTAQVSISPSQLSGTGQNGIFSLYGNTSSSTAGNFYVLYRNGTAYATGSSTKAYCFDVTASGSVAGARFQLVSSQASIANNTSTALTSPAYQGGASGAYVWAITATTNVMNVMPGVYVFGDGVHATSAGFQVDSNTDVYVVHMDCFEQ